jgi:hypothetical protein
VASRNSCRLACLALLFWTAAQAQADGNNLGGEECTDLSGLPILFDVDWQTQIKPIINEQFETGRCTSCHNPGQFDGDLDLTDIGIDAIYKLIPPGYVVPGRPLDSPLFDKTNCDLPGFGGFRMPFFQNPLTLEQQQLIYDWIAQGALGDIEGEPPIPRDFIFRDGAESLRWY